MELGTSTDVSTGSLRKRWARRRLVGTVYIIINAADLVGFVPPKRGRPHK
jgi:hypothetical protein